MCLRALAGGARVMFWVALCRVVAGNRGYAERMHFWFDGVPLGELSLRYQPAILHDLPAGSPSPPATSDGTV
jgi:hypothetical protein